MVGSHCTKAKIAVLVTGGGTNLQALIDSQGSIISHGEIVLVVSNNPNAFAPKRAENHNIDNVVISKKILGSQEAFESSLIQTLKEYEIDLVVLAGFMTILSQGFTDTFKNRIINVHPSLIPQLGG